MHLMGFVCWLWFELVCVSRLKTYRSFTRASEACRAHKQRFPQEKDEWTHSLNMNATFVCVCACQNVKISKHVTFSDVLLRKNVSRHPQYFKADDFQLCSGACVGENIAVPNDLVCVKWCKMVYPSIEEPKQTSFKITGVWLIRSRNWCLHVWVIVGFMWAKLYMSPILGLVGLFHVEKTRLFLCGL